MRMPKLKHWLCAALSTGLLMGTLAGCSTPEVALTVDGKEYPTGEYLAYLYANFNTAYMNYYYQNYYSGKTPSMDEFWSQKQAYGEGEDTASLPQLAMEDYLKQTTRDTIVESQVYAKLLEEKKIAYDADEKKQLLDQIDSTYSQNDLTQLGFNKAHYTSAMLVSQLGKSTLFYGLYDNGGEKAMSDTEIRTYFDANFYGYKTIDISLQDDNGGDLSDDEIKKIDTRLEAYLKLYQKDKDFDKVIETYNADEEKIAASKTTTTTGTGTTTAATTTAATTTTTTAATTMTTAGGTGASGATTTTTTSSSTSDEKEEDKDPNFKDVDLSTADEAFAKVLKETKLNECRIVEYTTNSVKHKALILRLSPEKKVGRDNYFKDSRKSIIASAKQTEFNDMIKAQVTELKTKVVLNDRAIKMCSPKNFTK